MRWLFLLALAAGCDDDSEMSADMAVLPIGAECYNLSGSLGPCAPSLKCCSIPCTNGPFDGGCLDLPSECQPDPPPAGYGSCF